MIIKQDPVTGLWCREDGAVLMPPNGYRYKKFRWTFGSSHPNGYLHTGYKGKKHYVHQMVCRTFNGLAPEGKPFCDHIDRCKTNNTPGNLHWVSVRENNDNTDRVDQSIEKYKVRCCDDRAAYMKVYSKDYYNTHQEERKAYAAARAAKKKAQGLSYRKGPDGRCGWYPRIRT